MSVRERSSTRGCRSAFVRDTLRRSTLASSGLITTEGPARQSESAVRLGSIATRRFNGHAASIRRPGPLTSTSYVRASGCARLASLRISPSSGLRALGRSRYPERELPHQVEAETSEIVYLDLLLAGKPPNRFAWVMPEKLNLVHDHAQEIL